MAKISQKKLYLQTISEMVDFLDQTTIITDDNLQTNNDYITKSIADDSLEIFLRKKSNAENPLIQKARAYIRYYDYLLDIYKSTNKLNRIVSEYQYILQNENVEPYLKYLFLELIEDQLRMDDYEYLDDGNVVFRFQFNETICKAVISNIPMWVKYHQIIDDLASRFLPLVNFRDLDYYEIHALIEEDFSSISEHEYNEHVFPAVKKWVLPDVTIDLQIEDDPMSKMAQTIKNGDINRLNVLWMTYNYEKWDTLKINQLNDIINILKEDGNEQFEVFPGVCASCKEGCHGICIVGNKTRDYFSLIFPKVKGRLAIDECASLKIISDHYIVRNTRISTCDISKRKMDQIKKWTTT